MLSPERRLPSDRAVAWLLLITGMMGFAASFVLILEKFALLADPAYIPSCNVNPVLSCGNIMSTDQAEVFGFPNPLIGVAAFPVVAATGAVVLAGGQLRRWYWLGLQAGVTLATVFVGWLIFQSLYRIGALCPYCMVVWVVVILLFWFVTLRNAMTGMFGTRVTQSRVAPVLRDWQSTVLTAVAVVLVGLAVEQFWYYWSTLV